MADESDDDDALAAKINPPWWRQARGREIRREIADPKLQSLLRQEKRIWDILTEARTQQFSLTYNRARTYEALKRRLIEVLGGHLGIADAPDYNVVIRAVSALLRPDIVDLVDSGDLTEGEADTLAREAREPD